MWYLPSARNIEWLDAEMLQLVLMTLLGLTAGQDIVFRDVHLYAGDLCTLTNGGPGQCLPVSKCGRRYSDQKTICGFSGHEPIFCCDVVRRQCEGVRASLKRISDHMVGHVDMAEAGEFPFMALIKYRKFGAGDEEDSTQSRCGAVLVSKRFLLTAAHCITKGSEAIPYSVELGTISDSDPLADSYLIDTVYKHESYNRVQRQNDIGIVKLVKDVALHDQVKPICVHTNPADLSESLNMTVMGWGNTERDIESNVLLKGTVHIIPRTTCQAKFDEGISYGIQIEDTHICALGNKTEAGYYTDTCQGDSGGPMVWKKDIDNYLVAIVSAGQGCGSEYYAGIYTRVSKFLPWMIQKGVFTDL